MLCWLLHNIEIRDLIAFSALIVGLVSLCLTGSALRMQSRTRDVASYLEMRAIISGVWDEVTEELRKDETDDSSAEKKSLILKSKLTKLLNAVEAYCLLFNRSKLNNRLKNDIKKYLTKHIELILARERLYSHVKSHVERDADALFEMEKFSSSNDIEGFPRRNNADE